METEPQVAAATVDVAAGAPLLVVASLAGGDEVDATTVSNLLRENLKRTKEEEEKGRRVLEEKAKAKAAEKEEAQMLKLSERIRHDMPLTESEWAAWYRWQASSSGRKRKKRKKKKLPRGGRAHRRQRQWYVHGWFCWFGAPHAVFPSFVGRTQLLGIMDGMDQNDSTLRALVVGSGICKAGFAGVAPRAVFLPAGHRCLSSWPVWTRRSGTLRRAEHCGFSAVAVLQGR